MPNDVYRFATFTVDASAHVLWDGDTPLPLQEQPFQVLLALLESAGRVVTRDALRLRLWGTTTFVDFDQSLNSAMRRLRLALKDNSREPVYVETVPRVGFRFLQPVLVDAPAHACAKEATSRERDVEELAAMLPAHLVDRAAEAAARANAR